MGKRIVVSFVLALLLANCDLWTASAGEMKVSGADKTYKTFEPIILKAQEVTSKDAQFLWRVDSKQARVVRSGDTAYVWAPPGNYTVTLTAIDFEKKKVEEAEFTFTVEGGVPNPPGPSPGPGPDPGPGPGPSPQPVTPLVKALRDAYAQETDAARARHLAQLSRVYSEGAAEVARTSPKTLDPVWKVLSAKAKDYGLGGKIPKVQAALQQELKSKLPTRSDTPLDDRARQEIISVFTVAAQSLEQAAGGK